MLHWGAVTPSTVSIHHKTGIAKTLLAELPPELQQRFGYAPAVAAAHRAQELAAQARLQEVEQTRCAQKLAAEQAAVEVEKQRQEKQIVDKLAAKFAQVTNQASQVKTSSVTLRPLPFTVTNQPTKVEVKFNSSEVFTVYYTEIADIRPESDEYTARIRTDGGLNMLVMFNQHGLDFMTRSQQKLRPYEDNWMWTGSGWVWGAPGSKLRITVYAVKVNNQINRYGEQINLRLVGSGEYTDIAGAKTYSW